MCFTSTSPIQLLGRNPFCKYTLIYWIHLWIVLPNFPFQTATTTKELGGRSNSNSAQRARRGLRRSPSPGQAHCKGKGPCPFPSSSPPLSGCVFHSQASKTQGLWCLCVVKQSREKIMSWDLPAQMFTFRVCVCWVCEFLVAISKISLLYRNRKP